TFTAGIKHIDDAYAREHTPMPTGIYASLEITDTGAGLSVESSARVFEPFYNSQRDGARGGLGLAAVYGIVKQNGGYIWVESGENKGSTFQNLFPYPGERAAPPEKPSHLATHPTQHKEKDLVCRDVPPPPPPSPA